MRSTLFTVVLVAGLGTARPLLACSIAGPPAWEASLDEVNVDGERPSAPTAAFELRRAKGPGPAGCGSSCDDLGTLTIRVASTDDRTAPARLGWRVTLVEGSWAGFGGHEGAFVPFTPGRLEVVFVDGDGSAPIDAHLEIVSVDLAGNESEPRRLYVTHPGSMGCSSGALSGLAGPLVVLGLMRRRRLPR